MVPRCRQVIRLVSLQRGVLKVEQKMMGIQCSTYSEPWIFSDRNFAHHGICGLVFV